jgi:glycosyltransferase involved in cell wall biosynthesis
MLTYSFYESDSRVRRYAEALANRGEQVDVIALREQGQEDHSVYYGCNLYRIQERIPNEKGKLSYLFRIMKFLLKSSVFLTKQHLKKPYQLIHVHNIPDFLVFAAFIPKLFGAKIILDIHDILPEVFTAKFKAKENSIYFKALTSVERISAAFSDHVIVSNHIWGKRLISRSVAEQKCSVMLNYPDRSVFFERPRTRKDDKFIMIYPGTLNIHQGIDIEIKAFAKIKDQVPMAEFHIYGDGNDQDYFESLVSELGMQDRIFFKGGAPMNEIAEIIADADLGIEPKRDESFSGEALSMKIFEFMAAGVPVIASNTKIHRYYFNDSVLKFFKAGDENELAECMLLLIRDGDLRKQLVSNASQFLDEYLWEKRKNDYYKLVDSLTINS